MPSLFDPTRIGDTPVANRIFMAPLTRDRAGPGRTPTALMQTYYTQRASAGLIISEATQISAEGQGYLDTPGLYSAEQVAGWRRITDAVHAAGGRMFVQLWHVGRVSHHVLQPNGGTPVSSSAIQADGLTLQMPFPARMHPRILASQSKSSMTTAMSPSAAPACTEISPMPWRSCTSRPLAEVGRYATIGRC